MPVPIIPGSFLLPIGLLITGWCAQERAHWIGTDIGFALVGAGIPLLDLVCAVTGGVHSTNPMLDLTNLEENDIPHLTVAVMPKTGKVTLVTMETRRGSQRGSELAYGAECFWGNSAGRYGTMAIARGGKIWQISGTCQEVETLCLLLP